MSESSIYRTALPQLEGELFLSDGGLETSLIFEHGIDLPHFAAFHLLDDSKYRELVSSYFQPYIGIAQRFRSGFVIGSVTWRASEDWGRLLGYSKASLADANRTAIGLCDSIREASDAEVPMVISGCLGPRGDGYMPGAAMTADESRLYHEVQLGTFVETAADMVTAASLNYVEEAIGIARAAREMGMPLVESFTLGTDGALPNGESLEQAILHVDEATDGYVSYFGINCAHATHFEHLLVEAKPWTKRIRAVRANASKRSHQELDGSTELDTGDPVEFGRDYGRLKAAAGQLNILGGCCGTDHRHIEQIAMSCLGNPSQ
ncbi:homocysteine S-methyltransferase family protein [Verrucomicrobia bacterium]|jgi:S-methylmethionine-dependent homocysteine/selenocysteine methylase|nr:homocysteine S-methyltransferase [Verrucomicrobiota bacterium]MDA7510039.1 homocysteine S-methyltransferase family protein [Verrucomicrobiota bacterium]MDA7657350.1 homocysteine S-methyltransferase family protein [Verrucomicrobiota bacterium]